MREFSKVAPSFWTRGTGKELRGNQDAQLLALYLMTCPTANLTGIFYVPIVSMAHETGLPLDRVKLAIAAIEATGFAEYDRDVEMIWIPSMARWQLGDTVDPKDKRRHGQLRRELAKLDRHRFVVEFWERYSEAFCLGSAPTSDNMSCNRNAIGLHSASLERNRAQSTSITTETETETETEIPLTPNPSPPTASPAVTSDRGGEARPGSTKSASRRFDVGTPAAEEARHAFVAAVADAIGDPTFVLTRDARHIRALCDLLNAKAPRVGTHEAIRWIDPTVREWVTKTDPRFAAGWAPAKLLDWLNAGRPDSRASPASRREYAQPVSIAARRDLTNWEP